MEFQRVFHLAMLIVPLGTFAFPSGAPVEACDSLLPRHIHTTPKSATESPYIFTASASHYYPDTKRRKIKVRIRGAPFKGFFVVALDAETHSRVGFFMDANGMVSVPCSAITHTDGRPKLGATMIWQPPPDKKKGEVIFMATILESFSTYYSGLIASVPVKKVKKRPKRASLMNPLFDHDIDSVWTMRNITLT